MGATVESQQGGKGQGEIRRRAQGLGGAQEVGAGGGSRRALWVDGVNLAADPEYSPDGVFSFPAQLHISDRVYASSR